MNGNYLLEEEVLLVREPQKIPSAARVVRQSKERCDGGYKHSTPLNIETPAAATMSKPPFFEDWYPL